MQVAAALDEIERQHTLLAGRLESCATQAFAAAAPQAAGVMLRELLVELGLHFGLEEALMVDGAYDEFDHHRRQHIGIITELALLLDRLGEADDPGAFARGMDFVANWYRQHVTHGDQALLAWLAARDSA